MGIDYKASLSDGSVLPSYVVFDSGKLQFTISDNGVMTVGTANILLTGSLDQANLRQELRIKLNIQMGGPLDDMFDDMI